MKNLKSKRSQRPSAFSPVFHTPSFANASLLTLGVSLLVSCGELNKSQKIEEKLGMGRRPPSKLDRETDLNGYGLPLTSTPAGAQHQGDPNQPAGQPPKDKVALGDLASYALELVDRHSAGFGITRDELNPTPRLTILNSSLVSVSFQRVYMGTIPVRDCYFEVLFWKNSDETFSLRMVNNKTHGLIAIGGRTNLPASWDKLKSSLPFADSQNAELISTKQLVYGENLAPEDVKFVFATEFQIRNRTTKETYTVTVENGSERILEAYAHRVDVAKAFTAKVYPRNYKDTAFIEKPLPELPLTFGATATAVTTSIDALADPGDSTAATVNLMGSRATVVSYPATVPLSIGVTINKSFPDRFVLEGTGTALTGLNAYSNVVEVNRFARQFLLPTQSPFLGYNIPVFINVNTSSCNAFFDPTQPPLGIMAFYARGGACGNMAEINDVTFHEWGHGLDNSVGISAGISDGAFSEGIGDIVATYLTGIPEIGVGMNVANNNAIRSVQNTKVYPASVENLVHVDGQIIGGAFWDLRTNLIAAHGKTKGTHIAGSLFFNHLLNTDSYLDSYRNVLVLDDDDGDPNTQSPNFCAINSAFAKHGLAPAQNCLDPKEAATIDSSLIIATQKQEATGVTLMAATGLQKAETIIVCVGTRVQCNKDKALPRVTLVKEGTIDAKIAFVTTAPLAIKAQDTLTLYVQSKENQTIGSRMFKYVDK